MLLLYHMYMHYKMNFLFLLTKIHSIMFIIVVFLKLFHYCQNNFINFVVQIIMKIVFFMMMFIEIGKILSYKRFHFRKIDKHHHFSQSRHIFIFWNLHDVSYNHFSFPCWLLIFFCNIITIIFLFWINILFLIKIIRVKK